MEWNLVRQRKIDDIIRKYKDFNDEEFYLHFYRWGNTEYGGFDKFMEYLNNRVMGPEEDLFYRLYTFFRGRILQIERNKKLDELL